MSQTWKSVLWGRDLLKKGLRWKVGSGFKVKLFSDPWLPRPSTFKVISEGHKNVKMNVVDVITHSKEWNVEMLKQVHLPIDADFIRRLPISVVDLEDCLLWHYTKNGIYTVKGGYHLSLDMNVEEASSKPSQANSWMRL